MKIQNNIISSEKYDDEQFVMDFYILEKKKKLHCLANQYIEEAQQSSTIWNWSYTFVFLSPSLSSSSSIKVHKNNLVHDLLRYWCEPSLQSNEKLQQKNIENPSSSNSNIMLCWVHKIQIFCLKNSLSTLNSTQQSHRHLPFPGWTGVIYWTCLVAVRSSYIMRYRIVNILKRWDKKTILAKSMINGTKRRRQRRRRRRKKTIVFIYLICTGRKKNVVYQYKLYYVYSTSVQ